ncbi:MAG: amidohydrolase family protein [Planctomycetota bacterium]
MRALRRLWPLWILLGAHTQERSPADAPVQTTIADHHVHLLSPQLVADWKTLGATFSKEASAYSSMADLLAPASDRPALEHALIIPMAHFYGSAELRGALSLDEEGEWARVRNENDHCAREARKTPGETIAFCSVDFLRPYAWKEIRRCREEWQVRGVKLHLASAGADLRDEEQLAKLAAIASWAEAERVALLIHLDPQRRGLETSDVEHFLEKVLAPCPALEVSIAHLGGSGGYGDWTRSVFRTITKWLKAEKEAGRPRPGFFLDVSAVWLERESEGVPPSTEEQGQQLAKDLREAGFDRILFASDYPVFDPFESIEAMKESLPLEDEEWTTILKNRFPSVDRKR